MKRPLLLPLVPLYAAGAAMRAAALHLGLEPVHRLRRPVISIGNLSTGGTGKTPSTIALVRLLKREGVHVDVLSRGYGRKSSVIERVNIDRAGINGDARQFGDEPLLIAKNSGVPVYVGARRYLAGKLAERESETGVHLLDDGFQHRQLARQVDIVLVNSDDLNDWLLPAGNLRERVAALRRAHVLAVAAGDDPAVEQLNRLGFGPQRGQSIWRYRREMVAPPIPESLTDRSVVAFCGIGRPAQFFSGLSRLGFRVAATHAFSDHHRFTSSDLAMLRRLLESTGSGSLVTTAKDRIRLGDLAKEPDLAHRIVAVDLQVVFDDEAGIAAWLHARLHQILASPAGRSPELPL